MPEILQPDKSLAKGVSGQREMSSECISVDEKEALPSDHGGNGSNGGDFSDFGDWDDGAHDNDGHQSEYWFTPRGAYRTAVVWVIGSISSLFATISTILETRWIHSTHWAAVPLPRIMYANTAVLLISSITVAAAKADSSKGYRKRSHVLLRSTLLLGCAFVAGQILAWRELASHGIYLGSNAGSAFFYVITAIHAIHLVGGIMVLAYVILRANHLQGAGLEQAATESVALYWHFMDGLWIYLLLLLMMNGRV
jgi:cytochrome c oxidase subunit III